jgi:hypothetical protein
MAFSGFHVSLHRLDGSRNDPSEYLPIYGELAYSETLASAGTTTLAVPGGIKFLARISVSAPSWVTIGSTPGNPTSTSATRFYHDASYAYDVVVKQDDKFAWSAA